MCMFGSSPSPPPAPPPPPPPPPPPESTAETVGSPGRGTAVREGRASRARRRGVSALKIRLENVGSGSGVGGAY